MNAEGQSGIFSRIALLQGELRRNPRKLAGKSQNIVDFIFVACGEQQRWAVDARRQRRVKRGGWGMIEQ